MATELPKTLGDEFKRLAAMPGDGDVILAEDAPETPEETPTADASAQDTHATAASKPAPTKPTPAKPASAKPLNLDDFEEFRKYKAARDQKEAELQRQLAEHERQLEAHRRSAEETRLAVLNARLGDTQDEAERASLIDEAAALRGRAYYEQWQRWEQYKRERITAEGLDLQDTRFQKQYSGEQGALDFERDLLTAAKEQYQREAAELKQHAAPETIQALVRQELAKLAQAQGLNYADTGDAQSSGSPDIEKALDDFNLGRIDYQEFKRRTGAGRS